MQRWDTCLYANGRSDVDQGDTGLGAMDLEHLKKFKRQILELAEANRALNIRVFSFDKIKIDNDRSRKLAIIR